MPGLDGVALLKCLADVRPGLPVLLMSGYTPPDLARLGIVPPCAVLPKPFEADKLVQAVRACIDGEAVGTR
jgi:DNA-binding NtrC family response regulator